MIPITDLTWQGQSWQTQLTNAIRDIPTLAKALGLDLTDVATGFPVNVPLPYLSRIRAGDQKDPLLLQVLATSNELSEAGLRSPLSEEAFVAGFGMIQKYQGRALVITTGACAINCRYCFRRHFPYEQHQPSTDDWRELIASLALKTDLSEIILSGGDPLMLKDSRIDWIIKEIEQIPHIQTLRIHSRLPVVLPDRISKQLLDTFRRTRLSIVLVTHVNHANEIDQDVLLACQSLTSNGVTLLNQSVLLRQVNDSAEALASLSRRLISAGVVPYYLHLMDPVQGAEHFDVDEKTGIELITEIRSRLPGYMVPRLSRETPFETSKTVLA